MSVGKDLRATFCDEPKCEGEGESGKSFSVVGPKTLKSLGEWNDKISHIRVELDTWSQVDTGADPTVYLYDGAGCTGTKLAFTKDQGSFGDFYNRGFNDKANGIEVPRGARVVLYQHGNYTGWKKTFTGPIKVCDFSQHPPARNNDASSLKITTGYTTLPYGGFTLETDLTKFV